MAVGTLLHKAKRKTPSLKGNQYAFKNYVPQVSEAPFFFFKKKKKRKFIDNLGCLVDFIVEDANVNQC